MTSHCHFMELLSLQCSGWVDPCTVAIILTCQHRGVEKDMGLDIWNEKRSNIFNTRQLEKLINTISFNIKIPFLILCRSSWCHQNSSDLNMSDSIWNQDVSRKSCRFWGAAYMNQTCFTSKSKICSSIRTLLPAHRLSFLESLLMVSIHKVELWQYEVLEVRKRKS